MNELALFAGAGGGVLGSRLLGWRTVGYVEWEPFAQEVLQARIGDGCLDAAPIFGDIQRFISEGYADAYGRSGVVDVVSGGFPCQPFSVAGQRKADADERNMWPATIEVIRRVRPRFAFLENVPGLLSAVDAVGGHYFGTVLGDLAEAGFDVEWCVLGADDVGAPHRRKRLWLLAYRDTGRHLRDACDESPEELDGSQWWQSCRDACAEGSSLAHRPSDGRLQGRPEPGRFLGRSDAAECGGAMADATDGSRSRLTGKPDAGEGAGRALERPRAGAGCGGSCRGAPEGIGRTGATATEVARGVADSHLDRLESQRRSSLLDGFGPALGHDADGCGGAGAAMVHAPQQPEREPDDPARTQPWERSREDAGGGCDDGELAERIGTGLARRPRESRNDGGEQSTVERGGRDDIPHWPPGPADRAAWECVLAARPDLAPAVESPVRGVADGLAHRMDRPRASRVNRLRALGNGQVPETAATAFLVLAQRIGLVS